MNKQSMPSVLIVDHNRASLAAARAFAGLGYRVILGVAGYCDFAHLSRFVSETITIPDMAEAPGAAMAALRRIAAARPDITGILAVDETGTRLFASDEGDLPKRLTVYGPSASIVQAVSDKEKAAALAMELGLPVAPRIVVDNAADLVKAGREIGPPFVVKPVESNHDVYGRKVRIFHDLETFRAVAERWPPEGHRRLMVQRFNPGRRRNIAFNAVDGRIHSAVDMRVLATTAGDESGYGTLVETAAPHPALADYAARIAEALRYHGPGCPQFLVDEATGEITFLEINPRLDANVKLAELAMPYIAYGARIVEGRIDRPLDNPWAYRRGIRLFWMKGENQTLRRLLAERRYGALAARSALMLPRALTSHHALFSPDDPIPALASHLNPLAKLLPGLDRSTSGFVPG